MFIFIKKMDIIITSELLTYPGRFRVPSASLSVRRLKV
jgi:hypothetical protein